MFQLNPTPSLRMTRWSLFFVCMFLTSSMFWGMTACAPAPVSENNAENTSDGSTQKDGATQDSTPDAVADNKVVQDKSDPGDKTDPGDKNDPGDTDPPPVKTQCTEAWSKVTDTFKDATSLKSCAGNAVAEKIVKSLMNLQGVQIDNNGTKMTPCIEARCDANWVYVVSNSLPHYDFVQTTPNALKASILFYRVALKAKEIAQNVDADEISSMNGCQDAYKQQLSNANQGTQREPSGFCQMGQNSKAYMKETINGKTVYYRKLSCLGTIGFVITGVPIFGPNEAAIPDPWGNPLYFSPDKAGEDYVPSNLRDGAALDMCLGHTAQTMHYHGVNEACFERDSKGKPKSSYAVATASWDWNASLSGECTKESGIVGWASDGVPIKGPCVCLKRNPDGSCATLKRTRSSYHYAGLKSWGNDSGEQAALGKEGTACTKNEDCCTGTGRCHFKCKYTLIDDSAAPGGTKSEKRCVLRNYSWCTHRFKNRSAQDVSKAKFVYLDRCNGLKSADGYAYHVTSSFPLIIGCFKHEAKDALTTGGHGGNNGGGNQQPKQCNSDSDCKGACPQGSKGCGCRQAPQGQQGKICVPTCSSAQDCPQGAQCNNGICAQQGGNQQGPKSCNSTADCQGACPQGSKGCTCDNGPNGKICVPTCKSNSDCPQGGQQKLRCEPNKGICIPDGGRP